MWLKSELLGRHLTAAYSAGEANGRGSYNPNAFYSVVLVAYGPPKPWSAAAPPGHAPAFEVDEANHGGSGRCSLQQSKVQATPVTDV